MSITPIAPSHIIANPYGGGVMTPEIRQDRIDCLLAELADAFALADEADAAGDHETLSVWEEDIARIMDGLDYFGITPDHAVALVAK